MSQVQVKESANHQPYLVAMVDGAPHKVYEREFFIQPKRVSLYENAKGGPYKYCYYCPALDRQVSFPLPYTPEIAALRQQGLI